MEDLLSVKKQGSCRLTLPDGLQELMCDISREVLRAQPKNLNAFITNYLSALLVTRENLSIAAAVCEESRDASCCPELEDELRDIGLVEEDIERAKITIVKYFNKGLVNEKNLLMTLIKETDIFEGYWPAVQDAIRRAFLRHQRYHSVVYESSSESGKDEVALAVRHTLQQYRTTRPSDEEYNQMAEKVQTSYRAYGVTRARATKEESNVMKPNFAAEETVASELFNTREKPLDDVKPCPNWPKISINTISSTSLAGSYLKLPKYVPYSALDSTTTLTEFEEVPEMERANIYYSNEHSTFLKEENSMDAEGKLENKTKDNKKRISFEEVKNKTARAASFVNTEGIYKRPYKEGTTDIDCSDTNFIDTVSNKEKENSLLETSNVSQHRNVNAEIGLKNNAVNKALGFFSDDLEVVKQVLHMKDDLKNANIDAGNDTESDNDFVEADNISTESENEDTAFDNEHLSTDEEIVDADNDSDCSIEEEIKTRDVNINEM